MNKGIIVLYADLIVDFSMIVAVIYLYSQGFFKDITNESLNTIFLKLGLLGFVLIALNLYMIFKRK